MYLNIPYLQGKTQSFRLSNYLCKYSRYTSCLEYTDMYKNHLYFRIVLEWDKYDS